MTVKNIIPLLFVLAVPAVLAETLVSSSRISGVRFDYRSEDTLSLAAGETGCGFTWNNTDNWRRGGDAGGASVEVRMTQIDSRTGSSIGCVSVLGGGVGEGETATEPATAGTYSLELVVGGSAVADVRISCIGSVAETDGPAAKLDTRRISVRAISNATDEVFAFAFNNTADWRCGGDESGAAPVVRITEMDAQGATNSPSRWTEMPSVTSLACAGAEGRVAWTSDLRSFFRADLLVGDLTNGTAYFDFSGAAVTGRSIAEVCSPSCFTVLFGNGVYSVRGVIRDSDGVLLTEGVDYSLTVTSAAEVRPTSVIVTGISEWRGQVEIALPATTTMAEGASRSVAFDTRSFHPRRPLSNHEVLPICFDAGWWDDASIASLTVTPLDGDTPIADRRVTLTAEGSSGAAKWIPTGLEKYLAEIRSANGGTTNVIFDFTKAVVFSFDKPKVNSRMKTIRFTGRVATGMDEAIVKLRYGPKDEPNRHELTLSEITDESGETAFDSGAIPYNLPGDEMPTVVYSFVVAGTDGDVEVYRYESELMQRKLTGNGLIVVFW